mmetsp:Transcript_40386/g.102591  ORF Transcript_40386/g.102591 Transcript_40386/m.102591 type:complete len:620 (+) Transcript_40386:40-1899(+)|eukprot:CAMPEP_0183461932 /NCGR_PEP_ID=MMETSP0370-20130417/140686_1 /TAXON_ID=268820 /ORGANISM="Peridinium aciculiferum, Strain PAER-2" /LENGTH=619 /DNA_ID=CAMNT_0025653923 /DNA_START=103 /DNA_END=1962 /DNA_ORIENTATION=+
MASAAASHRVFVNRALNAGASKLPDRLFGMDTDELLSYSTPKVVWIRNRFVGTCYYSMITIVLLWVLVGQILLRNEHFMRKDVRGLPRLWYSHPTVGNCDPILPECEADFRSKAELVYCHENSGDAVADSQKGHCKYMDRLTLIPGGVTDYNLFVPTAMEIITEERHPGQDDDFLADDEHGGEYRAEPGTKCLRGQFLCEQRGGKRHQFFYVADVQSFVVRFSSSYERDTIRGNSLQLPGFVGICDSLRRSGNASRSWTDRRNNQTEHRCDGNYRIKNLTCGPNVSCAAMRDFDFMEDTGMSMMGRGLANKVHAVTESVIANETDDAGGNASREGNSSKENKTEEGNDDDDDDDKDDAGPIVVAGRPKADVALLARGGRARRLKKSHRRFLGKNHGKLHLDPRLHKGQHTNDKLNEFSDNWGDVFTLGRLLQLAGADLDLDHNLDGWTTRQSGTAIEVLAVYNNLYPLLSTFGYKPVQYHYTVNELMLPYVSRTSLSPVQPPDYPNGRTYENSYGVLISFKVSGSFGFFNPVYLVLMLTAALALTATASTVTDLFFLYLSDQRDNFFHLKYDVSPDFSEMWRCDKCGFYNLDDTETCAGVAKFCCPKTTPHCGAERPKQ